MGEFLFGHIRRLARRFLRLLDGGLFLRHGIFGLQVRRALFAQPALVVPAHFVADPLAASLALDKVRLGFLHSGIKSVVVRLGPTGRVHAMRGIGCAAQQPAEQSRRHVQRVGNESAGSRLESRLVTVAALVAKELELESAIRAVIRVILGKLNQSRRSS